MNPFSGWATEHGKLHLAETLFTNHRYLIRCPNCPGHDGAPGHIRDQAGKPHRGNLKRRSYRCRRSNTKDATESCSRVTCSAYIELAKRQLDPELFANVVEQVAASYQPVQEEHQTLKSYLTRSYSRSSSSGVDTVATVSKRRAEDELPGSSPKREKLRHDESFLTTKSSAFAPSIRPALKRIRELVGLLGRELEALSVTLEPPEQDDSQPSQTASDLSDQLLSDPPPESPWKEPPSTSSVDDISVADLSAEDLSIDEPTAEDLFASFIRAKTSSERKEVRQRAKKHGLHAPFQLLITQRRNLQQSKKR